MKNRSLSELGGVLAIVLPGGVAAFVVARTLAAYWGRDWLASLIVAAIGAALALGLLELFARVLRAGSLERELRALPPLPNEATIESASPRLSALLRARLESLPMPSTGEGSASFLTGLLVMLGLLGTLLGLFQTVSGAGHALTSSADIDALRRSLSAPIDGLTRSFGCSAAGISASAMLGLAIALVRRREVRTQRLFYAYATGPLRTLSPLRRQMRALEQLVTQGSALPSAANALEEVGAKLGDLSTQLISLQQAALKSQQRAFSDLLASVRGDFTKAAGETGEALHARVSPLLEQMATRSGEALLAQAGALAEVAREVTQQIECDAEARREAAAQASAALQTRFDEAERVRATARAQELDALTGLAGRVTRDGERREQAFSERWSELLVRFDTQLTAARERDEAVSAAAHERDGLTLGRLDEVTTRVGSELERLSSALSGQVQQRALSERAQDERAERTLLQLKAAADALAHGSVEQGEALQLALTRLQSSLEESTARQAHVVESGIARQAQLVEASVARQAGVLTQQAEVVEKSVTRQVALLEQSVAHQNDALERGSARQAELLDAALAGQSHGLEDLTARVKALLPELADAAQAGAVHTLARLRELVEAQAARFAELEATIERGRVQHTSGLGDQLASHAADLEQRLARTSTAVQDAAAIWQASSAEMQSVAELFANSVERQREASDAWLESLGEVEGAVERAGRDAARDALSEQLASTQEVFARQLQFQRELFEQLRTLRAAPSGASASHGEHDVSVG